MASVVNANETNFHDEVLTGGQAVLVDFWASWCGHCSRLAPVMDELAQEIGDKVKVVKVNVDENRGLAQKYGVMGLPTMIVFKDGEQVEKLTGYMPKDTITAKIGKVI